MDVFFRQKVMTGPVAQSCYTCSDSFEREVFATRRTNDTTTRSTSNVWGNGKKDATSPPFENLDILQNIISFIGENQYRFVAAVNNDFKAVYLQLFPDNKQTSYNASTVEHVKICLKSQYIHHTCTSTLCNSVARHGSISALIHLQSAGVPWDRSTCATAAKFGHLHILKHLHTHGCPWASDTCSNAALYGHLPLLQWARANGCPWDNDTCINAALNSHTSLLRWAQAKVVRQRKL
jgi:hypothetical protein